MCLHRPLFLVLFVWVLAACSSAPEPIPDAGGSLPDTGGGPVEDAGDSAVDAGSWTDATVDDGGPLDGGPLDGGPLDGGSLEDAGVPRPDAGPVSCTEGVSPPTGAPYVTLARGYVRGSSTAEGSAFLGIPFAAPPIAQLRWRAPEPQSACFAESLDATRFGARCPQMEGTNYVGDEDCLYLNVWTPSLTAPLKPVLFFIHGGGNAVGGTSQASNGLVLYDGAVLAARGDAVVVTSSYRLGQLGWLAHSAIDDASGRSGNYGLLDLIEALRWVKENIAAFGGDPDRVMIFGESAGALNTCMLLASPLSEDLFHAALMQSGGCPGPTRASVATESGEIIQALGCGTETDPAACLRAIDAETIIRTRTPAIDVAGAQTKMQPHVDGYVLPATPLETLESGVNENVALIVGANADETARSVPAIQNEAQYQAAVRALFPVPALSSAVLAQYPASAFNTPRAAFIRLTTDAKFVCPARKILRARVRGGRTAYRYIFTHRVEGGALRLFGAFHGLELAFVFGKLTEGGYQPSTAEEALATSMQDYWASFAADGIPDVVGEAVWPEYEEATDPYLRFDGAGITAEAGFRTDDCDFWDGLLPGG